MNKVFVASPIYGAVEPLFAQSMMKFLMEPKCSIVYREQLGDSLVARARNNLAADFLGSDCTHLLFIDSDLIFSADHVARLLSHDEPIVGGLYPKKQRELAWVLNADANVNEADERGLLSVRYVGTGFLMIRRDVFERMIEEYGSQIEYHPDEAPEDERRHDFFSCGVYQSPNGHRRYLSEDWFFCQRALDLGYKVYADCRVVLKHVGKCVYPIENPFPTG